MYGILAAMDPRTIHWSPYLFWGAVKLLKIFGVLPGAVAALSARKLYQKWRQRKAIEGWPSTEARILSGHVRQEGARVYWATITYSYYVGEYRAGHYVRHFRKEEDADEFVRQLKDRRLQVHYNDTKPDESVILDRDVELIAMLGPQIG